MSKVAKQRSLRALALKTAVIMAVVMTTMGLSVFAYGLANTKPVEGGAQVTVDKPVGEVFALLADPRDAYRWRPGISAIRDFREGRDGLAAWTEVDEQGNELPLRQTERVENQRVVIVVDDEHVQFKGEWVFTFEQSDDGTVVRVKETAEVPNAFFRGIFHLLANRDAAQQAHLNALKSYAERTRN